MKKKIITILLILNIILFTNKTTSFAFIPIWETIDDTTEVNSESIDAGNFLNIESESAILVEQTTGEVLYEKNSHEKLRPASVTKIMTLLIIMEALDRGDISLETLIPCSEKAESMGGSQIWLNAKESLSVHDMLKAICVVSANDCTVALAEYIAGSEELFVKMMNDKAKELGMNDTTFKNCHGIDEDDHLTSSYDISIMSRELLEKHPLIKDYTTIWMDTLRDGKSELVNTNRLIRTYEGATGLKTGSTSLALYNLSASATRNNLSLIAVVLRAPTPNLRFSEAKLLLDYGFNTYTFKQLSNKGEYVQNISVSKGTLNNVNLVFENDSGVILKKSDSNNITQEIILNDTIEAPINYGDILGKVNFYNNNYYIKTVNLIAETNIKKKSLINMFEHISYNWFNLLR